MCLTWGSLVQRPICFFNLGLPNFVLKTAVSNLCDPHRSQLFGGSCSAARWGIWWAKNRCLMGRSWLSFLQAAATTTAMATKYGADITVVGKLLCLGEPGLLHMHMWAGRFFGAWIDYWVMSSYSFDWMSSVQLRWWLFSVQWLMKTSLRVQKIMKCAWRIFGGTWLKVRCITWFGSVLLPPLFAF